MEGQIDLVHLSPDLGDIEPQLLQDLSPRNSIPGEDQDNPLENGLHGLFKGKGPGISSSSSSRRIREAAQGSGLPLIEPLKVWFDDWPRRRRAWNTYSDQWEAQYHRSFACDRHDFVHLVTITGSSLDGMPAKLFFKSKLTSRLEGVALANRHIENTLEAFLQEKGKGRGQEQEQEIKVEKWVEEEKQKEEGAEEGRAEPPNTLDTPNQNAPQASGTSKTSISPIPELSSNGDDAIHVDR